jgi:hypothetical protein
MLARDAIRREREFREQKKLVQTIERLKRVRLTLEGIELADEDSANLVFIRQSVKRSIWGTAILTVGVEQFEILDSFSHPTSRARQLLWVALVPDVAWEVDGYRGDAVVPAFGGVSGKTGAEQRVDIVVDAEAAAGKAAVLEDLHQGSVEDADGGDLVVESAGQGGPAVARFHAEVVALEIDVSVETGSRARLLGVSPLPSALLVAIRVLGKGGERR